MRRRLVAEVPPGRRDLLRITHFPDAHGRVTGRGARSLNYFAHGFLHVDRPSFLAGTALPDWLSAAARRVRFRPEGVEAQIRSGRLSGETLEIACGVRQHLRDDGCFHALPAFCELSDLLAAKFRRVLTGDRRRPSFLGHVAIEMLLDAVLIERFPARLEAYYRSFEAVCPTRISTAAGQLAGAPIAELPEWIGAFVRMRFLEDYRTSEGLHHRLNQVVRRVKLSPLPGAGLAVLDEGRELVRRRLDDLIPTFVPK